MRNRISILPNLFLLFCLNMLVGCDDFDYPGTKPGNYTPVRDKNISVDIGDMDTLRIPAIGGSASFNVTSNTFWSIKGIQKMKNKKTGEVIETNANWITAPVKVFDGDGKIEVVIAANIGRNRRIADLYFYTADENVYQSLPIAQANDPVLLKPLEISFDFTDNSIMNWPGVRSFGDYTYLMNGVDYSFDLGDCSVGSYLVIYQAGSYLGLPIINDYMLTRVSVLVSANNKSQRDAAITEDVEGKIVVGDRQLWEATGGVTVIYDLHDTDYDTRYYLYCLGQGLPVAGLTLRYEP